MSVIKYVMKEKSFDLRRDVCVDDKKDWPFLLNLKHLCFRVIHRMPDSLRITMPIANIRNTRANTDICCFLGNQ